MIWSIHSETKTMKIQTRTDVIKIGGKKPALHSFCHQRFQHTIMLASVQQFPHTCLCTSQFTTDCTTQYRNVY